MLLRKIRPASRSAFDNVQEAIMKLQSDVRAKACTTTIALPEVLDGPAGIT
jgi:hypothetical protein